MRFTTGWQQEEGKHRQKYHTLGYYASRRAALIALADYNKRPYDLNLHHITCAELYQKWYNKHTARLSQSSCYSFNAARKKCAALWKQPVSSIKKAHMQAILDDNQHLSASVQTRLKTIFSGIFRLALENDLINVDYSHYLEKSSTATQVPRSIFSHGEISCLWQNINLALPLPNVSRHHYIDVRLVDTALILLYKRTKTYNTQPLVASCPVPASGKAIIKNNTNKEITWEIKSTEYDINADGRPTIGANGKTIDDILKDGTGGDL